VVECDGRGMFQKVMECHGRNILEGDHMTDHVTDHVTNHVTKMS